PGPEMLAHEIALPLPAGSLRRGRHGPEGGMSTTATRLAARRFAALGIVLVLWEALVRFGLINPFYVPPPSKVGATLFDLFADGEIWTHIEATFGAALLGLLLGVVVGGALGTAAALLPRLGEI